MVVEVKELVEVGAIFANKAKMKPVWFKWKHLPYKITKVLYTWSDRKGRTVSDHYSVTDDMNVYHLSYNKETLQWRLVAIDDGQYQRTGNIAC
ncbi:MAG: hypothetical protein ACE5GM_08365 [bacterium]